MLQIFILGGYGGLGTSRDFFMDVHFVALDTWTWEKVTHRRAIAETSAPVFGYHSHALAVVRHLTTERGRPPPQIPEQKGIPPHPRSDHCACVTGRRIVITGGRGWSHGTAPRYFAFSLG